MISKEPENKNAFQNGTYFTVSARVAFRIILDFLFHNKNEKILLPAYIGETDKEGSGVFDPIRQLLINYEFYRVNSDLSVCYDDIKQKIESRRFKAVLLIHYFGFIQKQIQEIKEICIRSNVVLIEDCAHCFHSKHNGIQAGQFGDFAVFSIHKIIPTKNGGILKVNNDFENIKLDLKKSEIIEIDDLFKYCNSNYPVINKKRIDNYNYYISNWIDNDYIEPIFKHKLYEVVPLNFPVIIKNGLREKVYFHFLNNGVVTCSLYYRLIKEISKDFYSESYKISNSILNFPVHQDTEKEDIEMVLKIINTINAF